MTPDCLIKLKTVVSSDVYQKLDDALNSQDQKAWDTVMQESHADMQFLRRQVLFDSNIKTDIVAYINKQGKLGIKPEQALSDMISGSGSRQFSGIVPLDKYIEGVRGPTLSRLTELIHKTRPKFLGLNRSRDGEYAQNFVKNLFGDSDASGAKGMDTLADAWKTTTQELLERFNAAGGSITKLEDFNIPLNHYSPKLLKAGEEKWVQDAKELFNLRRLPKSKEMSDDELLRKIYNNITSESKTPLDIEEIGVRNARKLGNSHQEFRWLQPKNGASWTKYTQAYGRHSSPIDAMLEYIDTMSTQIGLMEKLGTNPTKMVDDVISHIRSKTKRNQAGAMAKASLDQIVSKNPGYESHVTNLLRGVRNFQTTTKLGMAPITALSDTAYMTTTALYNGMSPIKALTRHIKNLNPANHNDRQLAGRLGLLMEYAMSRATALNRYSDINAYGYLHRAADFSTRASGLNHWTTTARMSFGLEFSANMAKSAKKEYGSIPKGLRRALDRYGITQEDWSAISKATINEKGTEFIDVNKLTDKKLAARIIGMIKEETNFAVPEPNAKARATATLGVPTNTVANEFVKVATQFKTFGVSILLSHMGRALDKGTPFPVRMGYGMSTLIGTTAIGIAVVQLKDIAKGRNPREMSPTLAFEGFLQGGSTGVLGDIVFNNPKLFGGFPAFVAGPTGSDINKLLIAMHGTKGQFDAVVKDWQKEAKKIGGQAAITALELPANLWQLRVAIERLGIDAINRETNPKFNRQIRSKRKWMKEERQQDYWWRPGQDKPERFK